MRIVDVRKFDKGYCCYVNQEYDIETLEKNKKFTIVCTYSKNKELLGKEFYFTLKGNLTAAFAKIYVMKLLGHVKEIQKGKQNATGRVLQRKKQK